MTKKLNCKRENFQCGGKCQPERYRCPSQKGKEASESLNKIQQLLLFDQAPQAVATLSPSLNKYAKLIKEIVDGTMPLPDEMLRDDLVARSANEDGADNLMLVEDAEITLEEANGLSAWLGNNHMIINKLLYYTDAEIEEIERNDEDDSIKYAFTAAVRAIQALKKLEREYRYEPELLRDVGDYDEKKLRQNYEFGRTLRIKSEKLEEFMEPYKEALKNKTSYINTTFASSTAYKNPFIMNNNVEIIINAKRDGDTAGICVDPFKDALFDGEAEVLFPPFTKFKVLKIEEAKVELIGSELDLLEKLLGDKYDTSELETKIAMLLEAYSAFSVGLASREELLAEIKTLYFPQSDDIFMLRKIISKIKHKAIKIYLEEA